MMDKNIIFSQTPTHLQWKIGQSFMGIVAITLTGETVFLILFTESKSSNNDCFMNIQTDEIHAGTSG